jgi:hypothetical protein
VGRLPLQEKHSTNPVVETAAQPYIDEEEVLGAFTWGLIFTFGRIVADAGTMPVASIRLL